MGPDTDSGATSHGVTVNAVAPGYIETDLTRDYLAKPSIREDLVSLVPAWTTTRWP